MEKEDLDNNFNVGTPTKENIEYAFKNLLFYINSSACLDLYEKHKQSLMKKNYKILNLI